MLESVLTRSVSEGRVPFIVSRPNSGDFARSSDSVLRQIDKDKREDLEPVFRKRNLTIPFPNR
jgi:hypothetical protein